MYNLIKQSQRLTKSFHLLRCHELLTEVRHCASRGNRYSQVKFHGSAQSRGLLATDVQYRIIISREKSGSRSKKRQVGRRKEEEDSDEEDLESDDEDEADKEDGSEVKSYNLSSLRVDVILKQAFNLKRKKIEEDFYNNKIRLNGRVVFKKSEQVHSGDEIDIVKGFSEISNKLIEVSRVEILKVSESNADEEKVLIKMKKFKNLVIENYPDGDVWKVSEAEKEV